MRDVDLHLTLIIGGALIVFGLFAGWRGARAPNPHKGPRMMPWRFLMLLSAAGALMMLVHLLNLLGVTTGRR